MAAFITTTSRYSRIPLPLLLAALLPVPVSICLPQPVRAAQADAKAMLTPGSSLAATITADDGTVKITWNGDTAATTGGTPPYIMQWQRSTDPAFAASKPADIGPAATVAKTDAPPPLEDHGLTNGTVYYYRLRVRDAASNEAYYRLLAAEPLPTTGLLLIGDSWLVQLAPGAVKGEQIAGNLLLPLLTARMAGISHIRTVNRGVGGTNTANWKPGGNLLPKTMEAAPAAQYGWAFVALGINDSSQKYGSFEPDVYEKQLSAIADELISSGYRVILQSPPYIVSQGANHADVGVARLAGYRESIARIVAAQNRSHPGKCFNADPNGTMYQYTVGHYDSIGIDHVHPTGAAPGSITVAAIWAENIARILTTASRP